MDDGFAYIGANVRTARRRFGITLRELAVRIGMHEVALGRVERGLCIPSAAAVSEICRVLGVSGDAILRPPGPVPNDYPQALAIGRKSPISEELQGRCRQVIDAVHALEDICGAQKHSRIPLSLAVRPDESGMGALADTVRVQTRVNAGVILDYFELFESFGLRVLVMPLSPERHSLSYLDRANHNVFFFINSEICPERQIFRLLFELGLVYLADGRFPAADPTPRRLAKLFAAFFLMPAEAIRTTVSQIGLLDQRWPYELLLRIKHRFGVSAEAFLYRLEELELIHPDDHQTIRSTIYEHYTKTKYGEPGGSRRVLNPNGRVWDLAAAAASHPQAAKELPQLLQTLKTHQIVEDDAT